MMPEHADHADFKIERFDFIDPVPPVNTDSGHGFLLRKSSAHLFGLGR
jgi:hypothetical protein